jgi:colanic acid biosynthesis glycosyl transferase WcaI
VPIRLLIVTHYYPPEVAVPATRLHELARRLVARGHRVTVVAPWPHHPTGVVPPTYPRRPVVVETLDGVRVLRTWVFARPNEGFVRLLDQLSFAVAAALVGPVAGRADAVLTISPPIFLGLTGALLARLNRAPLLLYIGDLWLESAVEMGLLRNRLLVYLTHLFVRATYSWSARLLVVTRGIAARLRGQGIPAGKIELLTNGVDTDWLRPVPGARALRREMGVDDAFVVLYAGTHGLAHGLDVAVDAAARLRHRPEIRFLFVGEGADKERLSRRAAELALENVRFMPGQPRDRMPALLSAGDACLVPLRNLPFARGAIPTKMLEAMATERPVVLAVGGEAADILTEAGAGIVVPPEDPDALAAAVEALAGDPARARALGAAGRRWVAGHFGRDQLATRLEALLAEAAAERARP